jgi:magnesium chelatase family protein
LPIRSRRRRPGAGARGAADEFEFSHDKRATVSLAPAELPKESGRPDPFGLPIALGILAAAGQIETARLEAFEFAGELSLGGELRPVHGALAVGLALHRNATPREAWRPLVLPRQSADNIRKIGAAPSTRRPSPTPLFRGQDQQG